jgi:type II secretion system protein J
VNARRSTRAGFTLIEVLLALTIMAWIMLQITIVLQSTRTSRDSIHNIQEQQLAGPAILARIESDLRALTLYNRDARYALRVQNRVLSGFEADSLDFVCTTDGLLPHREQANEAYRRADLNEVGYHLRPNPSSDDFLELYRREDFGLDDKPFEGGEFAFLHDRVKGFEIRVYAEDGVEAEPEEEWGEDEELVGLPARLEIELTLELAPRLLRESIVKLDKVVTYKRIFRFPAALAQAQELALVPLIPRIEKPTLQTPGGGTPPPEEGGGGGDGGGDGRGGTGGVGGGDANGSGGVGGGG